MNTQYNLSKKNFTKQINLVLTSHPNNPVFLNHTKAPCVIKEADFYHKKMPQLSAYNKLGKVDVKLWFATDHDGHHQTKNKTGFFTIANLMQQIAINNYLLNYYRGSDFYRYKLLCQQNKMEQKLLHYTDGLQFDYLQNKIPCSYTDICEVDYALSMQQKALYNTYQYRIAGEDLLSEAGRKDISDKLAELARLNKENGFNMAPEIIIANCNSPEQVDILKNLMQKAGFKAKIIPLVEDFIEEEAFNKICQNDRDIDTIMIAGSDLNARKTYTGNLWLTLKLQLQMLNYPHLNTIFIGRGTTINRSLAVKGSSRANSLEGFNFSTTVQGSAAQHLMQNEDYFNNLSSQLINDKPSSAKQFKDALPVLEAVFKDVSSHQIKLQTEPYYSQMFLPSYREVFFASNVGGSRYKPSSSDYLIKDKRAISQSGFHQTSGFNPEAMFWHNLSPKTKTLIAEQVKKDNPVIMQWLSHYWLLHQNTNFEAAKNYITDPVVLNQYKLSLDSFKRFIVDELKIEDKMPKKNQAFQINDAVLLKDYAEQQTNLSQSFIKEEKKEDLRTKVKDILRHESQLINGIG